MKNPQEVQNCISWGFKIAERMGFEPTIQLPIYKLSRLAPSTTRTPLYFIAVANNCKIYEERKFSPKFIQN